MKIDEGKRAEGLDFLRSWAHAGGADSVLVIEDRIAAVVRYPASRAHGRRTGTRILFTAEPCDCGAGSCDGWIVKAEGAIGAAGKEGLDSN